MRKGACEKGNIQVTVRQSWADQKTGKSTVKCFATNNGVSHGSEAGVMRTFSSPAGALDLLEPRLMSWGGGSSASPCVASLCEARRCERNMGR